MRLSMALEVSARCRSWNSLTQLATVLTISLAVLRGAFTLAGFRWARSERFTIFTTFFSDIFGLSIAAFQEPAALSFSKPCLIQAFELFRKLDQRNPCLKVPFLPCLLGGKLVDLFQESDVLDAAGSVLVAEKHNRMSLVMTTSP